MSPQCMYMKSFDLVSDKIVACFQCTELFVCSSGGEDLLCVQAIQCVIVCQQGGHALDQLKPLRPCVRRRF